jgi:hypothetical protein
MTHSMPATDPVDQDVSHTATRLAPCGFIPQEPAFAGYRVQLAQDLCPKRPSGETSLCSILSGLHGFQVNEP